MTASRPEPDRPSAVADREGDELIVTVAGPWHVVDGVPPWSDIAPEPAELERVRLRADGLGRWDSSLLVFVQQVQSWCDEQRVGFERGELPERLRRSLDLLATARDAADRPEPAPSRRGLRAVAKELWRSVRGVLEFVGDVVLATAAVAAAPRRFPWGSWLEQLRACGAGALPIVSLIGLLVGVILAFQAALQLRRFGADIYIADLVVLSVVREMGPVMTAVVLAGRTGSAFAAEIGKMVAGEEIDALRAIGVSPVSFVVLPRVLALVPMLPLLTLYADALGIAGGAVIAERTLGIPPAAFWTETQKAFGGSDLAAGLIKSVVFAVLVGMAGCLRGMQCERSSAGVGVAATSAAVAGILLVIVADAVFGEVFSVLGL